MTVDHPIMVKYNDNNIDSERFSRNVQSNTAKTWITDLLVPKSANSKFLPTIFYGDP